MDKYDLILLKIISQYTNEGERPRISIQQIDRMFWSRVEEQQFGKIPLGEILKRLEENGLIQSASEPVSFWGYYITSKGRRLLV